MPQSRRKDDIREALVSALIAAFGIVACLGPLFACFYFFEPVARMTIHDHWREVAIVAIIAFVIAFGATLDSAMWLGWLRVWRTGGKDE